MDDRSIPSQAIDRLPPALKEALERLCEAESIALIEVRSISIEDEEISVCVERLGGHNRIITYPLTVLLDHR
jgi:hypothetical protein